MEDIRSDRARMHENTRDVYSALNTGDPLQGPFHTNKDIFMLAASVGFSKKNKKPLEPGKKEGIRLEVFTEKDRDLLKAIALAHTNDIHVLAKQPDDIISPQVLTIAEQYAHGGIEELRALLIEKPGHKLWNLVDLMHQFKE
jgi:dnd system-associated protein 4